jgi:septum site-determining protein MinC
MARGPPWILLAKRSVTLLRGRRDGLELSFSGRVLAEAFDELEARLSEQPSFYRGASAVANVGATVPSTEDLSRLRDLLASAGIALRALSGVGEELERLAQTEGLEFERPALRDPAARARRPKPAEDARLSESARSLVADFAGARDDIATRRRRGEASVRRVKLEPESARTTHELRLVETPPTTLYHAATLRGGQVLHHAGNIVVVGDVNPGAELIATGDILVFGRLAGIAHAGAQGDENARIYAVDLAATQLRIATFIAADDGVKRRGAPAAKVAVARDARIVIFPLGEVPA